METAARTRGQTYLGRRNRKSLSDPTQILVHHTESTGSKSREIPMAWLPSSRRPRIKVNVDLA